MFDVHCPECRRRVLIFPGQVTGVRNDEHGIVVLYTCWCGAAGAWRTGAAAARSGEAAQRHVLAS